MCGYSAGRDAAHIISLLEAIMSAVTGLQAQVVALQEEIAGLRADQATQHDALVVETAQIADALATLQQAVIDLQALVDAGAADQAALQVITTNIADATAQIVAARAQTASTTVEIEGIIMPPAAPVIEP